MGDARRLSKEHPEDAMRKGIATPITLIVLLVVFVSLLAATSYMALGALKGTATERAVYQAFLVSESALDALPVLLRKAGCGGNAPTDYTLPAQGGPTAQATYVYKAGTLQENGIPKLPQTGGTITVEAVAEYGGAKARVEKSFQMGCGILGAIPAALTSRPRVEVRGNAKVIGENFATSTGVLPRTFPASGLTQVVIGSNTQLLVPPEQNGKRQPFALSVADASLIPVGGYIQIPTGGTAKTYRVEAKSGNTLTLLPLFSPSATDVILPLAPVGLVEYGVKDYDAATKTFTLSEVRGLVVGQKFKVGGYEGTIQGINLEAKRITVSWTTSEPSPSQIGEGTPFIPQVVGVASHLGIDTDGGANIQNGQLPNSPLVPADRDQLFQRVFGMSKQEFLRLYPPSSSFNGNLSNWELKVVNGPLNLTGNSSICGQGILVVFGELTVNGSCGSGFQGLIYVAGDYDQQGNASITGAVVVEGEADIGCSSEDCETKIAGTQAKNQEGKIEYSALVLHRLRMASAGAVNVTPIAGTWRRR